MLKLVVKILALFFFSASAAQTNYDTLLLGGKLGEYNDYSPPYLYWLPADKSNNSYEAVINKFRDNKFIKWNKWKAFTKGITGKPYWLAIRVKDTSESLQKYLWSFYITSCKFDYYELDSTYQLINKYQTSTNQPISQRPYPVRSISFPFDIKGGETKNLLVRVQATNTDVLYATQDFATTEDFLLWEIGYTVVMNRYFGFFIFALLANFLLFIFMSNRIYGWLSIYIAFLLLYNIHDFKFDVLIFPDWLLNWFVLIPKFAWVIGATFSSLIVFNRFSEQRKYFPNWFRVSAFIIRVLQALMLINILSHLIIKDHQNSILVYTRFISYFILGGAIFFQFINLFYLSFKKQRAGLFFLLSSGPLIISAFVYFYYMFTDVNLFIVLPGNVINACCFEVILLTIIFIYDYRNKNLDRNRLLNESLIAERKITSAILKTQEQERKRIAEDLHDELGSSLAALKLRLQKIALPRDEINDVLNVVDKASTDARNISHNLMPPEFEKTNLEELLTGYFKRLSNETSTRFHFHCSGYKNLFSKDNELMIYRIIMELTSNILKHADASEATVQLIYFENQLEIMAEDNGQGIEDKNNNGIGLRNINSRVDYLGGQLKIDSSANGTTIMIQIPFKTLAL